MTQAQALDILKLGHTVFLTGAAGSGKTYVLNQYIRLLKKSGVGVAITASTGIAATHLGGTTIHSWSGVGIREALSKSDIHDLLSKSYLQKHFAGARVLIIDEASMLHPDLLDLVNQVCKAFKESDLPFGGMQAVLAGDLFQLPPIAKNGATTKYFTDSAAWNEMQPSVCYITEQYRHDDDELTQVLNAIRSNSVDEGTYESLRGQHNATISDVATPTKLYTHNVDVDRINEQELAKITGEPTAYEMQSRGRKPLVETLIKSCLAPALLRLKKGALVMFVKNNFEQGYVNGTLGTVVGFDRDTGYPIIKIRSGKTITATPQSWAIEEEGKVKAEINQLPLRLAWAITVHKSQGMTLDAAEIDLSKSFVPGMGYVALSRVRTLSGLRLMGLNDMALAVDGRVIEIDKTLRDLSQETAGFIRSLGEEAKQHGQQKFIERHATRKTHEKNVLTIDTTKTLIETRKSVEMVANERGLSIGTIIGHLEKVRARGDALAIDHLRPDPARFTTIVRAFTASGGGLLSPVKELLGDDYSYEELRLVRLFLDT